MPTLYWLKRKLCQYVDRFRPLIQNGSLSIFLILINFLIISISNSIISVTVFIHYFETTHILYIQTVQNFLCNRFLYQKITFYSRFSHIPLNLIQYSYQKPLKQHNTNRSIKLSSSQEINDVDKYVKGVNDQHRRHRDRWAKNWLSLIDTLPNAKL